MLCTPLGDRGIKKPIHKSDELLNIRGGIAAKIFNCYSDLSSRSLTGGVGTFITVELTVRVAKASQGHIPLPFLISN